MLLLPVYLAGFVAFVVLLVYGMAISRLMSVRVRRVREIRSIRPLDLPEETLELLFMQGRCLEALGFERCEALTEDYLIAGVSEPSRSILYRDGLGIHLARLTLAESPTPVQPVELSFYSCAVDGRLIETVALRAHRLPPGLPDHQIVDANTLSWEEQYSRHLSAVAVADRFVPLRIDGAALVDRLVSLREKALEFELGEGRFVSANDGTLRFSLPWAVRTVIRANSGERKRLRALAEHAKRGAAGASERSYSGVDRSLAPDLAAHRRREAVERSRRSGLVRKLLYFAASVLVFALAFGIQLTPRTILLLLAVLFIHELGHALAMRSLGYEDLQILFVPFLGAVASGRKDNATAWQEVVVLLAGPVPGILLGTTIMVTGWGTDVDWIRNGAQFMLFLNYLNLLPIVPLDGGRIMSIVLFDRNPSIQFGFGAASALAIIGVGFWLFEPLIVCIGVVLLAGVPRQLDQLRTFAKVRAKLASSAGCGAMSPPDRLRSVYSELRATKFDGWNSETRYQFVRHVLERLDRQTADLRVAVASLSAYCVVVVVPVGLLALGHAPELDDRGPRVPLLVESEREDPSEAIEGHVAAAPASRESVQRVTPLPEGYAPTVE